MTAARREGSDGLAIVLAVVLATDGLLWAAAAASAWLDGHSLPAGHLLAPLGAFGHLGDPSRAWGSKVGGPVLYWSVAGLVLVGAGTAAWAVWRLWHHDAASKADDPTRGEGLAGRRQVRCAAGEKALLTKSATLRPSLAHPTPMEVGFRLGRSRGITCWASVEDSMLLLGPPRSGKGQSVVIPMVLDAPGAVLTTSTRPDNLAVTFTARSRKGPMAVFDPQALARSGGPVPRLRWSPIRGCERPQTAMARAETLVADSTRSGVDNGNFWRTQAVSAVRCLLHAAALDGRVAADLYRWSHAAPAAKEAISILTRHPGAAAGWDRALDAIVAADERMRDSTWAMVANTFAPLADPDVLDAVSPPEGEHFDPGAFLAESGTLYLLGTASGASAASNLVAALAEDVLEAARQMAAGSPGSRLDPPLAVVLDEAANYPLASLPSLMSEGGGSGITTLAVLQSLSQARDRWGREAAGAIWDAAIVKMVLGGSANADDLADLSRLIGDRAVKEHSETVSGWGAGRSVSTTVRHRPILEPADIRRIGMGFGLLLLRSAPPIMMTLSPWTARKEAAQLSAERAEFERAVRAVRVSAAGV